MRIIKKYLNKYIYLQEKEIIDKLRLKQYNNGISKTAEATDELISNKNADTVRSEALATQAKSYNAKFTRAWKISQQNNSETVTNEYNKGIAKEKYISPEERQKIIDNLTFNIIL